MISELQTLDAVEVTQVIYRNGARFIRDSSSARQVAYRFVLKPCRHFGIDMPLRIVGTVGS